MSNAIKSSASVQYGELALKMNSYWVVWNMQASNQQYVEHRYKATCCSESHEARYSEADALPANMHCGCELWGPGQGLTLSATR